MFCLCIDSASSDAIWQQLEAVIFIESPRVVVIVLGEDHDLSDNLKRLGPGVKYRRVKIMGGLTELQKMKAIYKQFLALQKKKASDAEWTRFEKKVHTEMDPIIKELEANSTTDYPHIQHLMWAGRDYLYPMLKDCRTKKNRDQQRYKEHLMEAERIMNL